ncbi:MAG TPA: hypothetical protein VFZ97_18755 [Acidimicrobiales bacterium]
MTPDSSTTITDTGTDVSAALANEASIIDLACAKDNVGLITGPPLGELIGTLPFMTSALSWRYT